MARRRLPIIPILVICGCASPDTGSDTPLDDAPCRIARAVSDAAFDVRRGDTVEVVLSPCGSEGHFIRDFVSPEAG